MKADSTAEINARARARAAYFDWLVIRHGSIDLVEMADDPAPVGLRHIFVPLRMSHKDISDTSMSAPTNVVKAETEDTMPGSAAWDVLVEHRFVLIAGRPGSGKTTLVKALITEVCGRHSSAFRERILQQSGLAPIPLILREIPNLRDVQDLAGLLHVWWENLARDSGGKLDLPRLRQSLAHDEAPFPCLYLFDGIDEVGGPEVRTKVILWAQQAHALGHRVIVTGRPSGFEGINWAALKMTELPGVERYEKPRVWHLTPLAWPQIDRFIRKWYQAREDWSHKQQQGIPRFLAALQDATRPHFLTLARRPIFLTLMALIHCTRNEMPHGRAALYKAIVDVYLERQEKHRQLTYAVKSADTILPHWPPGDTRLALGYIAWQSQLKAGSLDEYDDDNKRQITWTKTDFIQALEGQLKKPEYGRFVELAPNDGERLLDYYLHPSGLVVELSPQDIQLAHLSFQEYLCAEYLQGRLTGRKLEQHFQDIQNQLGKPGWDEVGLLLLAIHAERTQNQGHFELLGLLDLGDEKQAVLLSKAMTGQELPIHPSDRQAWLPVLLACALVHNDSVILDDLKSVAAWEVAGLALMKKLFLEPDPTIQWMHLTNPLVETLPEGLEASENTLPQLAQQWCDHRSEKMRKSALLQVLVVSGWGLALAQETPVQDPELHDILSAWVANLTLEDVWVREIGDATIIPQQVMLLLEILISTQEHNQGLLAETQRQVPLDVWLLQGEWWDEDAMVWDEVTQPCVLLSLCPHSPPPERTRLALLLYQVSIVIEGLSQPCDTAMAAFSRSLSLSLARSRFRSWSRSRSRPRSRSRSRSVFRSRSQSLSLSRSLSLSLFQSRSVFWPPPTPPPLPRSWSVREVLTESVQDHLSDAVSAKIGQLLPADFDPKNDDLITALGAFAGQYAAPDWFQKQADDPKLMLSQGLRPGEPLPKRLGFFDARGRLCAEQTRVNLVKLKTWLASDDDILQFAFPDGLAEAEKTVLVEDLAILRGQPWSPHAAVVALLQDWSASKPVRVCTPEANEQQLIRDIDTFLQTRNT